jgi:hypothetical protein
MSLVRKIAWFLSANFLRERVQLTSLRRTRGRVSSFSEKLLWYCQASRKEVSARDSA